ncbi:molybdopterin synthase catalytic subunit MoaE [Marinobacterium arenosum]|uniref:molybdopterin synthase catalytic subunit MoaE n=1 Tax=Marinobacterium arenosum TaxID=2862496 RepID=UPI001C95E310|nr:molybdopterin synthase catalytic subunit MoaE [Marinobacterium arenosum]MBY4677866.1 molybdopterin synthase catalytic subunit MoaE [Marinobacterium arenosum]
MANTLVRVQNEDFDLAALAEQLRSEDASSGAIVTFTGIVRELVDGELQGMFLEHYPGMTENALRKIAEQAHQRWDLQQVIIIHRVGELHLNDNIVFVGVGSGHRKDAFEAAQFVMDYLKKDAPFWKKEISADGERWVEQKQSDLAAAGRWKK